MRYIFAPLLACGVAFALFWLMQWMTAAPEVPLDAPEEIRVVALDKPREEEEEPEPETEQLFEAAAAPPSAPPASAAIDLPDQLSLVADNELGIEMNLPALNVPVQMGGSSGFGDGFGGFGGTGGTGSGGPGGYGSGQGFKGARLVPISTARPQIPRIAFEQGIEGWVEVIFVVLQDGTVDNVRIIDAEPKGVFEAVAVESISNWLYASHPRAREVKQKVYFRLRDFQFNWDR